MTTPDARVAVREAVTRAVDASGLGATEIGNLFGVRRQTVYQWLGGDIPLDRIGPLSESWVSPSSSGSATTTRHHGPSGPAAWTRRWTRSSMTRL